MAKLYKKSFLDKVILRVDFTAPYKAADKTMPKNAADIILKSFPIPEPRNVISNEIMISDVEASKTVTEKTEWLYHGKDKEKTLTISSNCFSISVNKYERLSKLKNDLSEISKILMEVEEFSINRFGLRYINKIDLNEERPFYWDEYINPNLLGMLKFNENQDVISRAFSNIVNRFDDGMTLNFQYGMHNPDYPSNIRKKTFILDYDASCQGVLEYSDIKKTFEKAHRRILDLFELSITESLRNKMQVTRSE